MWDIEDKAMAIKRERDLIKTYWRPVNGTPCTTKRFFNTRSSALEIVGPLIEKAKERMHGGNDELKAQAGVDHGGAVLGGLLQNQWQQLRKTGRIRRRLVRKMSSLGAPLTRDLSKDDIVVMCVLLSTQIIR